MLRSLVSLKLGDTSRLSLTIKNSGTAPITNISLEVIDETNTISNALTYSGTIEPARSHAFSNTLTISGTTSAMTLIDGSYVLIEGTVETLDGSTLNIDPIKVRVK